MSDHTQPRNVPQLLAALSADLQVLVADTMGLARAEMQRTASALATSMAGIVAGVIVLLIGVVVLAAALVLIAVALGLPPWAAALLVGVLLTAAGGITAWSFVTELKSVSVKLDETRQSVAETLAWLKTQTLP